MKIIGLLGGMSRESTVGYYRVINRGVKETLGGLYPGYPKIQFYSPSVFIRSVVVPPCRVRPCTSSRLTLNKNRRTLNAAFSSILGIHSAKIVLYSVDFEVIKKMQSAGDWDGTANLLATAAKNIQAAGAGFILICTNTMHKVAPQIEAEIDIPLLHIADVTAQMLESAGIKAVGLPGTAFTMEQDFYKGRLVEQFGLSVLTPNESDREIIHNVIYEELW